MKRSKLLKRLKRLLNASASEQRRQYTELMNTLKQLRQKSRQLQQRLQSCDQAQEKQQLEEKLAILQQKRRKGLLLARELKQRSATPRKTQK
ncbi:hypothetical protein [Bacterioplanoides pacificum]|uniref:Uncharacterized protein n=1 Tax=Bacterioplanoides pacificum TaxID=1171596 RepID=A0ABV7VNS9_9GAMM